MTQAEKKAKAMISRRSMNALLMDWMVTSTMSGDIEEISIVRGWIMDELEKRNPEAFERWIMESALDETLPAYMTA